MVTVVVQGKSQKDSERFPCDSWRHARVKDACEKALEEEGVTNRGECLARRLTRKGWMRK